MANDHDDKLRACAEEITAFLKRPTGVAHPAPIGEILRRHFPPPPDIAGRMSEGEFTRHTCDMTPEQRRDFIREEMDRARASEAALAARINRLETRMVEGRFKTHGDGGLDELVEDAINKCGLLIKERNELAARIAALEAELAACKAAKSLDPWKMTEAQLEHNISEFKGALENLNKPRNSRWPN